MNVMNYKDYSARTEYSYEDVCFIGHIARIGDIVGFHEESVSELKAAFEGAVDDYIATCKKLRRLAKRRTQAKLCFAYT